MNKYHVVIEFNRDDDFIGEKVTNKFWVDDVEGLEQVTLEGFAKPVSNLSKVFPVLSLSK